MSTTNLRNLARGGRRYWAIRHRIFQAVARSSSDTDEKLSDFLGQRLFSLKSTDGWLAVDLSLPDWSILEKLQDASDRGIGFRYLKLVAHYIKYNIDRINAVDELNAEYSTSLIADSGGRCVDSLEKAQAVDRQSVFYFKLYASYHAGLGNATSEYFSTHNHSVWARRVLLYPLIFYFLNIPTSAVFERMLGQYIATSNTADLQRDLVCLLIQIPGRRNRSLAFKCYVALLCHPYDALEILSDYLESVIANGKPVSHCESKIFFEIAELLPTSRIATLVLFLKSHSVSYRPVISCTESFKRFAFSSTQLAILNNFIGPNYFTDIDREIDSNSCLAILNRMKSNRYPLSEDFAYISRVARRSFFTLAGQMLFVFLTGIYMFEREEKILEYRRLTTHIFLLGSLTPFTLTAPRGAEALASNFFPLQGDLTFGEVEASVDACLSSLAIKDRWWIKKFHWSQRSNQARLQVKPWMKAIHDTMPIFGNQRYLSGVDWTFFDAVVRKLRARFFEGSLDAAYVLLLRSVELRPREKGVVELVLKSSFPTNQGFAVFFEYLSAAFSGTAIAFVRFLMTPDTILKMELETDYTAALAARLAALERGAELFGFSENIMTSRQLDVERNVVATTLALFSVDTCQFEIPWARLEQEFLAEAEDAYNAYAALENPVTSINIVSSFKKPFHYVFVNGQLQDYQLPNQDSSLAYVFLAMIDVFLSHPAYGIEAILAVRIRHDNLCRELRVALQEFFTRGAAKSRLLVPLNYNAIQMQLESVLSDAAQAWVDKYMHTGRMSPETAIFDFRPNNDELIALISFDEVPALDIIARRCAEWLRSRLEQHLCDARSKLETELAPSLKSAISGKIAELVSINDSYKEALLDHNEILAHVIDARLAILSDWFKIPLLVASRSMQWSDIHGMVLRRFHFDCDKGSLSIDAWLDGGIRYSIDPEFIRTAYDMWCEIVNNSLRHSGLRRSHIRVVSKNLPGGAALLFSSSAAFGKTYERDIAGHPSDPTTLTLFGSKSSGLDKIAHMAAAMAVKPLSILVFRRRRSFHVVVPIVPGEA